MDSVKSLNLFWTVLRLDGSTLCACSIIEKANYSEDGLYEKKMEKGRWKDEKVTLAEALKSEKATEN